MTKWSFNQKIKIKKMLPHNLLAEKVILGSILMNYNLLDTTIQTLNKQSFYFKNHQELYDIMLRMHSKNLKIDIITISCYVQDNGLLINIGGLKTLLNLVNQVPNILYFDDYIALVQEKFLRRQLIKLGYKIVNSAFITSIKLEHILVDLELKLFSINSKIKDKTLIRINHLFYNVIKELKNKSLNPEIPGISSGFYNLDSLTQGLQPGELIIIAGRPSTGKTALSLNIGLNISKISKLPVIYFSLEMSKEQVLYRLLSSESQINSTRLKIGNLYKNDWGRLIKTIKKLSNLLFYIDETTNLSIENVRTKIKTIVFEQLKIGAIIVDYLQLMQNSNTKEENRTQELSKITRALKNIAREFNIPVIALSQLNRNFQTRTSQRPLLSDLRESGSIEQDADLVLILHRPNENNLNPSNEKQLMDLIIAKQRNGPTGTISLMFNKDLLKFINN